MSNLTRKPSLPRGKAEIEEAYGSILAPFAVKAPREHSRAVDEAEEGDNRGSFQRDRDRIVHTRAFRKLMYKTQVFVNHEGDYFRTRMTHTMEVSQFARGICKSLALNEDLAEAIALGHDLGHTPFGHAVERYLSELFEKKGLDAFYHNEHGVRVVDLLEKRRPDTLGLNLTYEVREGILKHNGDRSGAFPELLPDLPCSTLEGQVVGVVDTVAYVCHDLEDGILSGLVEHARRSSPDIDRDFGELESMARERAGVAIDTRQSQDTFFIRDLIHYFIQQLTLDSLASLQNHSIETLEDVQALAQQGIQIICFSPDNASFFKRFKKIIYANIYDSQTVETMDRKAVMVVERLFGAFCDKPKLMLPEWYYRYTHWEKKYGEPNIRVIFDYLAGLTDRSALEEYERVFNPGIKI